MRLRLQPQEAALLRVLLDELEERLDEPDDPALRRLFPPAHADRESEEQYRSLVGDQLLSGRTKALATVRETLGSDRLDLAQADAWLRARNDLPARARHAPGRERGDRLRGSFDLQDPRGRDLAVYGYLSWLQEQLVEALQPASDL